MRDEQPTVAELEEEGQAIAFDNWKADQAIAEHERDQELWKPKEAFYKWAESVGGDDSYYNEYHDRRAALGITKEDDERWDNQQWQQWQDLPF
jgi:hypothetical protein